MAPLKETLDLDRFAQSAARSAAMAQESLSKRAKSVLLLLLTLLQHGGGSKKSFTFQGPFWGRLWTSRLSEGFPNCDSKAIPKILNHFDRQFGALLGLDILGPFWGLCADLEPQNQQLLPPEGPHLPMWLVFGSILTCFSLFLDQNLRYAA